MDSPITRRQFNTAMAAIPLAGDSAMMASTCRPSKFRGRYGVIHFAGTQQASDTWRLNFWLRVGQYNSEGQCLFLCVTPSDEFLHRLQDVGMSRKPSVNTKQIAVDAAKLPHGPVGLALLLESKFNADNHEHLYIQPSMCAWGEYRNRSDIVKKSLWIEP